MGDQKYAVNYASASSVVDTAEEAAGDLTGVDTDLTSALSAAEGALPPTFAVALGRLRTIRTDHSRDVKRAKTYVDGCVGAVRACLSEYEHASAEMVAEQKATESKVTFEHGSALPGLENRINDRISERTSDPFEDAPPRRETRAERYEFEHESGPGGSETTTTRTTDSNGTAYEHKATDRVAVGEDRTTTSTTTTETVRDGSQSYSETTYSGTGFDTGSGGEETSASGTTTTFDDNGRTTTTERGSMNVPVAP